MGKFLSHVCLAALCCAALPIFPAGAQTASFTILETPNGYSNNHLNGIAALSANDVWAAGYYTSQAGDYLNLAMHWDGSAWTITPTPNPQLPFVNQLNKLAALAPDNVWAIGGFSDSYSLRWDGSVWSEVALPPIINRGFVVSNYLQDIASTSATDIWAVGQMDSLEGGTWTLTVHWNGTEWIQVPSPNKPTPSGSSYSSALTSTVALAPNDVWAVGYYRVGNTEHTLVEHWDGTQWSIIPSPDGPTGDGWLRGVHASSPNDIWAVGEYDKTDFASMAKGLTMHWNGTTWSVFVPPAPPSPWYVNPLNHVVNIAPNDAYAVGQWQNPTQGLSTYVIHWDGAAWTQVSSQDMPGSGSGWNQLNDITRDSAGGLWTAGSKQASFGNPTFSLVERSAGSAQTDTVTIMRAEYTTSRKQLRIVATTSDPAATLTAYVTSTETLIGTLMNNAGRHTGRFRMMTNPQNITVKSSSGGSASKAVVVR